MSYKRALTLVEAAEALSVHPNTLRVWCQKGIVPASKPGRDWRILPESIDEVLRRPAVPVQRVHQVEKVVIPLFPVKRRKHA